MKAEQNINCPNTCIVYIQKSNKNGIDCFKKNKIPLDNHSPSSTKTNSTVIKSKARLLKTKLRKSFVKKTKKG